jgi:serine phosphatase RsbU (regulator of sigma subunit)
VALATVVVLGAAVAAGLVLGFRGRHDAGRAALAIDNERLRAERDQVTASLQASLMPARLPRIPGWTLSAVYRPGGCQDEVVVAGDFYDVFEVADGWMVLLGDAAGHGIAAAAVTGRVRSAARTAALGGRGPADLLCVVNRVLRDAGDAATCTALCLQLPASRPGTAIIAAAGHPLPYVVGAGGLTVAASTGTLLGAIDGGRWPESRVALAPGDTLVAFTDGVTETPGRAERFGEHRLVELLQRADPDPARLVRHADDVLDRFWDGATRDDTLLLAARYGPGAPQAAGG